MKKKILYGLIGLFLVIQLFRPAKNNSNDQTYHVSTKYNVPADVSQLMSVACNDCHSNNTRYPWYAEVQPAAWWLANHVKEGKEKLNFSEFTNLSIDRQNHQFEEIMEVVEEKEMPLPSYTWLGLHPEANLSDGQRQMLVRWASAQMDMLRSQYPADVLDREDDDRD